jgi:hypothetical protein
MDQKAVEKLESKIEEAIAEIIVKVGLKKLPEPPHTGRKTSGSNRPLGFLLDLGEKLAQVGAEGRSLVCLVDAAHQ